MSLLHDLSDELTVRFGAPTGISNLQFDTLAAGPHPLDVDWMRRDSLLGKVAPRTTQAYFRERGVVPTMPGPLLTEADPARGIGSRWIIPVRWQGRTHGYIWVPPAQLPRMHDGHLVRDRPPRPRRPRRRHLPLRRERRGLSPPGGTRLERVPPHDGRQAPPDPAPGRGGVPYPQRTSEP